MSYHLLVDPILHTACEYLKTQIDLEVNYNWSLSYTELVIYWGSTGVRVGHVDGTLCVLSLEPFSSGIILQLSDPNSLTKLVGIIKRLRGNE